MNLNIDGILYLRVKDPYKASYGVEDPEFAITQLAQTTMRSEIGKITLDTLFRERENLNLGIVEAINHVSKKMPLKKKLARLYFFKRVWKCEHRYCVNRAFQSF